MEKFLIIFIVSGLGLLIADGFNFPLAVGNRWGLTNGLFLLYCFVKEWR